MLRDGLLCRSEAAQLRWGEVEFRDDGAALLHIPRSKTDQEAEGPVLYIGGAAAEALPAIIPEEGAPDPNIGVFGLSAKQTGRSVDAAGLGDGFTGHSGRVGMAQDLAASGVELPALMTAGRWKSAKMPARYTERQAADRGAVARYYLPAKSSQYGLLRSTTLDKIKSFSHQVPSGGVIGRLSDYTRRKKLPSPCSQGRGFSCGNSGASACRIVNFSLGLRLCDAFRHFPLLPDSYLCP